MIPRHIVTSLALAPVFTASAAAAQGETGVVPGARIRLTQPVFIDGKDIGRVHRAAVGTLVSIDSTSLTAQMEEGTLLTLPFSAVNRLQISEGAISPTQGAFRGMVTGALIGGGLLGAYHGLKRLLPSDPQRSSGCPEGCGGERPTLRDILPPVAAATVGGAALGFGIGSRQREAWRDVDPRFVPAVGSASDLSLSVSLRF